MKAAVGVVLREAALCVMVRAGFHRNCNPFLIFFHIGADVINLPSVGLLVTVGKCLHVSVKARAPQRRHAAGWAWPALPSSPALRSSAAGCNDSSSVCLWTGCSACRSACWGLRGEEPFMWFVTLALCFCACIEQPVDAGLRGGRPRLGACVCAWPRWTGSKSCRMRCFPPSSPFMEANNVLERRPGFLEPDFVISGPCSPGAFERQGRDAAPALLF